MDFKEYLLSLHWNMFDRYPAQGLDVYIHCSTEDNSNHRFVKVLQFNAVCFDFKRLVSKSLDRQQWRFSWLPAEKIEKDYDT